MPDGTRVGASCTSGGYSVGISAKSIGMAMPPDLRSRHGAQGQHVRITMDARVVEDRPL